jgi:16S rRNA (guanine527-N7)-methyltransferase
MKSGFLAHELRIRIFFSSSSQSNMHPARIAELLQPFLSPSPNPCHSEPAKDGEESAVLSAAQRQSISIYIDILLRWNARINLTAIRNQEEIVTRHFGESLFAARHLFPLYPVSSSVLPVSGACPERSRRVVKGVDSANDQRLPLACPEGGEGTNHRVADLGSGAGFPGLPIKLWAPKISLTLIESNQKKAAFLREVVRALTLTDINIQNARAQDLPPNQAFDVVTLRAVEHFTSALPVAASLLARTGRLALLIGGSQTDQARATLPSFTWGQPVPIPGSKSRVLLIATREPTK